jgi:hypothetical protein
LYGLQNEMHGLRTDRVTDKAKTKGNFASWHDLNQKMVLFASSTDGETSPEEPSTFLTDFCTIVKSSDAQLVLTQTMLIEQHCTVQLSPGFVLALQKGIWLFRNQNVPSNLTILAVPRPNGNIEAFAQDLVLAMKTETPTLLNDSDLQKLTRQPLSFPSDQDVGSLEAHYTNMAGLLTLLLGEYSLLTRFARLWESHVKMNYARYTIQAASDKQFIRKLLLAFDIRVQLFLSQCMSAKARDDVPSSTLESTAFLSSILMQELSVSLTAAYQHANPGPNPPEGRPSAPREGKRPRISPTSYESQNWGALVTNNNQNAAWDITRLNIQFRRFTTRDNPGPSDICRKWHLKGQCNAECPRKDSHQALVGEARVRFTQWFNSCK